MKVDTLTKMVRNSPSFLKVGLLVVMFGVILIMVGKMTEQSIQKSILMILAICVLAGFFIFPSTTIGGPLSVLWKIINGLSFFYLLGLIYLSLHTRQQSIDAITTYIDPSLKLLDYEEVSYAQDCRIINHEKPNPYQSLYHAFFDIFALAHFLGWFFKTLICRDLKLILFASVTFELIQFSLRNVLNNFKQCWWDHIIIDILGCNLLGIICGFIVIDAFSLDRYRWSLRTAPLQHSHWQNFKKFWTSLDVSYLETKAFGSLRPFMKIVVFLVMFQLNDLTLFFVKYIYHIPPSHFLCLGRLLVVGLLTVNAVREYYDFLKHRAKFRKFTLMLFFAIISLEIFIVFKQSDNVFENAYIDETGKFLLGSLFALFLIFFIKIGISDIVRKTKGKLEKKPKVEEKKYCLQHAKIINEESYSLAKE